MAPVQFQKGDGPPLSQHQATLGVGLEIDVLDLPVADSHLSELLPDVGRLHRQLLPELTLLNYLLDVLDEGVLVQQLLNNLLDDLGLGHRLVSLVYHLPE
jgi:hypothetical protein